MHIYVYVTLTSVSWYMYFDEDYFLTNFTLTICRGRRFIDLFLHFISFYDCGLGLDERLFHYNYSHSLTYPYFNILFFCFLE